MSASFGQSALRLARIAACACGWKPCEFWAATPAELAAILAPPPGETHAVSRAEIERLMERDGNG